MMIIFALSINVMKSVLTLIFTILSLALVNAQTLSLKVHSQTNVLVNGQSTGTVTLSATGGTSPYQYSKNGGLYQTSPIFGSLAAGAYTFTVRDAAMNTFTLAVTITQLSSLAVQVGSLTNVNGFGQSNGSVSLVAAGGLAPYRYSIDGVNYNSSTTFNSLAANTYTFTVKDALDNIATVTVTITQSNVLSINLESQTNLTVIGQNNGSVTLSGRGGTPPYLFSKDGITYQVLPTFAGLAAGPHSFTIRDAVFDRATLEIIITQPEALSLLVNEKSNVGVNGQNTGSVTVEGKGGTPPYQYSRNGTTFQASGAFKNLAAGNYTFTVKDAASSLAITTVTINQPPVLTLTLNSKTDVDIYGKATGQVSLKASGGLPPYQYSKNGSDFQAEDSFAELSAGKYMFTVRDAASGFKTLEITVNQPKFDASSIKAMNNFTPNGDGINDKWQIEEASSLPPNKLIIIDRGGRVLITLVNYRNDWDGTVNGTPLAEGTYYYALSFEEPGLGVKKGFITLIR